VSTPFIHIVVPLTLFALLFLIKKHQLSRGDWFLLMGASLFGFFPDVVDKLVFQRPFIFHSFLVWLMLLAVFTVIYLAFPGYATRFAVLGAAAAAMHPILDLGYPIPFFLPLSWESWSFTANIVIRQTFPPTLESFNLWFGVESPVPAAGLGSLFNETDLVLILAFLFAFGLLGCSSVLSRIPIHLMHGRDRLEMYLPDFVTRKLTNPNQKGKEKEKLSLNDDSVSLMTPEKK